LDRSQEDTFLSAITDLQGLGEFDHSITELVVDRLVDVDPLDGQADLTRVEEGKSGNLLSNGRDIDVLADDGRVLSTTTQISKGTL
jgi:hypothetical protein